MNAYVSPTILAATTVVTNPLATRAMLVSVRISSWTARKLDKDATAKVNKDHDAEDDAGRYNKALIADDALDAITKIARKARDAHYERTLPWKDDGQRILPAAAWQHYTPPMNRLRQEFEAAVETFIAAYPVLKVDAQKRLGKLYKESEFPEIHQIRRKFAFDVDVMPMPDAADFRVELAAGQLDEIKAEVERSMHDALNTAMQDAWARIGRTVGHMVKKLTDYKPGEPGVRAKDTFRDSLVENIRDLVEILPSFNLTNDPVLTRTIERMRAELCTLSAQELRDNSAARMSTAAAAQSILDDVTAYLV